MKEKYAIKAMCLNVCVISSPIALMPVTESIRTRLCRFAEHSRRHNLTFASRQFTRRHYTCCYRYGWV